ncbi:MAG: nucleotidyltransferase domain-containing protein [Sideroxydans sp.]|nr:nucleotidyltransferase domain-containing protein [Sideroxydans sp.]
MNGRGVQLSARELEMVRDILMRVIPEREVWVFGSRVQGKANPYSDLDLAVIGEQPLPLASRAELADAFDQSDLTIKVDVVDWAAASESFRQIIASQKVLLKEKA